MSSDASSPSIIAVTGAAGYIGSWVVRTLLDAGYRVRGTVRNLQDASKVSHLKALFPTLELFEADLLADGSFDACFTGCAAVFHTASPFQLVVQDAQRDLVDPALKGTLNVLNSCQRVGVVRVVLTSSVAAIIGDKPVRDQVFTEADWNADSAVDRNPYRYSKTVAERAAWDFAGEHGLQLTTINPSFVLGRPLSSRADGTSVAFAQAAVQGKPVLGIAFSCVAVQDVALAHLRAFERPESVGKRFIVASEDQVSGVHLLNLLKQSGEFPNVNVETQLPNPPAIVGFKLSSRQAQEILGITLTPIDPTFLDMARAIVELNMHQ